MRLWVEHQSELVHFRLKHATRQAADRQPHGLPGRDAMPVLLQYADPHPHRREIDDVHQMLGWLDEFANRQVRMNHDAADRAANRQPQRTRLFVRRQRSLVHVERRRLSLQHLQRVEVLPMSLLRSISFCPEIDPAFAAGSTPARIFSERSMSFRAC